MRETVEDPPRLKLLTFNIQVGMESRHYGHYLANAWRHVLPSSGQQARLERIVEQIRPFDFIAVQEADAGSLRTQFVNQLEYLAHRAGFAHSGLAVTRDLRPVAQHCLGWMSRFPAKHFADHPLPGPIPGRRVISLDLLAPGGPIGIFVAHLSLGKQAQQRQLDFISSLVPAGEPAVLMGDLNCDDTLLRQHPALQQRGFWLPEQVPMTFPSWKPRRAIDHILLTPDLMLHNLETLPLKLSDHLPLAAEISRRRIAEPAA